MRNFALVLVFFVITSSCGTTGKAVKSNTVPERVIPIAIKINSPENIDIKSINMDDYRLRILERLEDFQPVKYMLVEADKEAEITLNLNIDNFKLTPRDKRVTREVYSKQIEMGVDTAGRPVYENARATSDLVRIQQRSNARLSIDLQIRGTPGKTYKHTFAPRYNYDVNYIQNVQGDSRAIAPHRYQSQSPVAEPDNTEFLLRLSADMLDQVAMQLRSYYRN